MSFFVVVGGSQFQEGLVLAALNIGNKVILVDKDPDCYCKVKFPESIFINESIRNVESVLNLLSPFNIIGAATVQSDNGVLLVEAIREKYGLIKNSVRSAELLTNKFKFRKFLYEVGISQIMPIIIEDNSFIPKGIDWSLPRVLKPTDSSGSRGVYFINSYDQFQSHLPLTLKHSFNNQAVLEPQLFGEERGAQVIVQDKSNFIVINHDDILFNNIPVAHSSLEQDWELNKKISALIVNLGLNRCILNVDYFQNKGGIEFIEIGMRLGATELDQLVTDVLDRDIYEIILDNYNLENIHINKEKNYKMYGILFNPFSYLISLPLVDSSAVSRVNYKGNDVQFKIDIGVTQARIMTSGIDRFGSFVSSGKIDDIKDLMKIILNEITNK